MSAQAAIVSREILLHQLYEAAELEHNLMCTYLYAAFSMKQGEPVLLVTPCLLKELMAFLRGILPQEILNASVEFLHFFVEVLKKCRITDGQVFFFTVELVVSHRLKTLRLLDGRVMFGGERCA